MTIAENRTLSTRNFAKRILFVVLAFLALVAIYNNEGFLIHHSDPEWAHIRPFQWVLLIHALAGVTALLLGPLQFSQSVRRKYLQAHRVTGRIYVSAIFVAAPLAVYIGLKFEPRYIGLATVAQGLIWFITAAMALFAARGGHIVQHKLWVGRSYGMTFIFVTARVILAVFPHLLEVDANFATVLWALILSAIIAPDLIMQGGEVFSPRRGQRPN